MCIVFVALDQHPDFPVVVAHNRDEYLERRTERMQPRAWQRGTCDAGAIAESGVLLAGRDVRAGGTWLGLRRLPRGGACRFATVLNNTSHKEPGVVGARSRGTLPLRFLAGDADQSPGDFVRALAGEQATEDMAGFSVICATFGGVAGTAAEAAFVRNRTISGQAAMQPALGPGVHALCNDATLDSDWGRVQRGRQLFAEALRAPGSKLSEELFCRLLADRTVPDKRAVGSEPPASNAPLFIVPDEEGPLAHGTRASTVMLCARDGRVYVEERCFDPASENAGGKLAYVSLASDGSTRWLPQTKSEVPGWSRL